MASHISDRVRGVLTLLAFQLDNGVYSRTVAGVADAGALTDGTRMVRLQVDAAGRWFEMLDGWGKVERDCDLRGFTDAREAVRHLVPALGVELDSVDEPDSVPVIVRGESVMLTPVTIAATQRWFADNALECIAQARAYVATGGREGFRVNDLESYTARQQECAAESLRASGHRSFAFIQRAVALQTGDCVPLLS